MRLYNQTRPHRALDGKTPEEVYCDNLDDMAHGCEVSILRGATKGMEHAVQTTGVSTLWRKDEDVNEDKVDS